MSIQPRDPQSLLAGLDPQQRAVATALDGPVIVRAGAGTGKTRAITHRIAYAVATDRHDPAATLAVTFTNRAAGEMSRRLSDLGVRGARVRTFHSAALRQLRWAWPHAIGGSMDEVFESKFPMVATALTANRLPTDPAVVRDVCTEIEWAKMLGASFEEYPALADTHGRKSPGGLDLPVIAEVYREYESAKRRANRMDFEDVLLLTVAVLEERTDLRRQVQASFRHITVDEFQDVSAIQRRLLSVWLGDRDDVCVVGDVAQTIYGFAGADSSHLTDFARQFDNASVVNLTRCYRCSPEIVDIAEQVLAAAPHHESLARVPLRSQCESGRKPTFDEYPDEHAEASAVVRRISDMIRAGREPGQIAILVRINALSEIFETKLAEAGIAFSVRGGRRFFERPEVKRAVSLLRARARTENLVGIQDLAVPAAVRKILDSVGYSDTPPTATGAVRESWESMAALVSLCDDVVATNPAASLADVVAVIAEREEAADAPSPNGVTIASLHAAKGMEWDAVFLVGLVDGMVPMSYATTPDQIEEERRLLYVGITRARRDLAVSWALTRAGVGRHRSPSRFLSTIRSGGRVAAASGEHAKSGRSGTKRPAACRRCGKALVTAQERSVRRCRTCPSDVDQQLLADLREWREREVIVRSDGRARLLPAYVVATDATLYALAEERPMTLDELAEIPGLGPTKLADHGDSLLQVVRRRQKRH